MILWHCWSSAIWLTLPANFSGIMQAGLSGSF
jgi:hypothetical protein